MCLALYIAISLERMLRLLCYKSHQDKDYRIDFSTVDAHVSESKVCIYTIFSHFNGVCGTW